MEGPSARFKFGTKKDGTPSYFQPFESVGESEFMAKHGYVDVLPTMNFEVEGKSVNSASEIRNMYKNAGAEDRKKLILALYGSGDEKILNIFNAKLG